MAYNRGVARDEYGNALFEAQVYVYEDDGSTLASIYTEETLTTAKDNPFLTGTDGVWEFYAAPGFYDISISKSGYSTVTLANQSLGTPFGAATISTGGVATVDTTNVEIDTTFGALDFTLLYGGGFELAATTEQLKYVGEPTGKALISLWLQWSAATGGDAIALKLIRNRSATPTVLTALEQDVPVAAAGESKLFYISYVDTIQTNDLFYGALSRGAGSESVTVSTGMISVTFLE